MISIQYIVFSAEIEDINAEYSMLFLFYDDIIIDRYFFGDLYLRQMYGICSEIPDFQ